MTPHPFVASDEDFDTRCVVCGCKERREIHQIEGIPRFCMPLGNAWSPCDAYSRFSWSCPC